MNRGATRFDPVSLSCMLVLMLAAAMAVFGVRVVQTADAGVRRAAAAAHRSAGEPK